MSDVETGEDQVLDEPTLLKALLRVRHWQTRGTFARQWDRVAKKVDPNLVGCCPSHAQFYRWLSGSVRGMPYPDTCMILEAMFPGYTVQQLFQPTRISRNKLLPVTSTEHGNNHPAVDVVKPSLTAHPMGQLKPTERDTGSPDLVTAYATRGLISRSKWNEAIRGAKKHLLLYGMAELGYALDDAVPEMLEEASESGCEVRILLLDPDYVGIAGIDSDEGSPPGTLAARIHSALTRFHQIGNKCGAAMQIRVYNAFPTVSIIRGDDRMILTPYLRFFVGSNSPSLELHNTSAVRVFDRYVRHFQSTWDFAKDA